MKYNTPGIFIEPEIKKIAPIKLSKTCLAGFVGITEKGPFHKPVRLTSFDQFKKIFGTYTGFSYLAYSVNGFFNSGGTECVVVRTAHISEKDPENSASKAYIDIINEVSGESVFSITAISEGTWGNRINIRLQRTTISQAIIMSVEDSCIVIKESNEYVSDYIVGDVIGIRCNEEISYRTITDIVTENENMILSVDSPVTLKDKEITFCESIRFNLSLSHDGKTEEYFYLSTNPNDDHYYVDEINKVSQLIRVTTCENSVVPGEVYHQFFNRGRDGILGLTPGDFIGHYKGLDDYKGIGVFESIHDISLIVIPDLLLFEEVVHNRSEREKAHNDIYAVQRAAIDQCERLGNRFAILDTPYITDTNELIKWADRFNTSYAALYYPGIEVLDPSDMTGISTLIMPGSGLVAGVYVACDMNEGIHRAPANKFLPDTVGILRQVNDIEYELLYPRGINCFRNVPGRGVKIWGARTLAEDISWRYINVRRTFNAIKKAIKESTGWAVFELNNMTLRKRIVRYVSAFLLDLHRDGFLTGNTPEEAFYVRCDDELNPLEDIDAGIITTEIGIAITRPAEFFVITMKASREQSVIS